MLFVITAKATLIQIYVCSQVSLPFVLEPWPCLCSWFWHPLSSLLRCTISMFFLSSVNFCFICLLFILIWVYVFQQGNLLFTVTIKRFACWWRWWIYFNRRKFTEKFTYNCNQKRINYAYLTNDWFIKSIFLLFMYEFHTIYISGLHIKSFNYVLSSRFWLKLYSMTVMI